MSDNNNVPYGTQLGLANALLQMRTWLYSEYGLETVYVQGAARGVTVYQVHNPNEGDLLSMWLGVQITLKEKLANFYTVIGNDRIEALGEYDKWNAAITNHTINARMLVMKSLFDEALQKRYRIYPKIRTGPNVVPVANVYKRAEPDAYVVNFSLSNGHTQSIIMNEDAAKNASTNDVFTLVDDVYTYYPANHFN